jgi:hypothetical protein
MYYNLFGAFHIQMCFVVISGGFTMSFSISSLEWEQEPLPMSRVSPHDLASSLSSVGNR